jgi:hypothetical protein
MLLLLKLLDLGRSVVFVNTTLPPKSINIRQFVDSEGVLLVEGNTVEAFASSERLCGSGIFNESESTISQY